MSSHKMDEARITKQENKLFFRRWLKEPKQLGTLAPISRGLAYRAAAQLSDPHRKKVVEIGAGTGRLSRALLGFGLPAQNFITVELDKELHQFLADSIPGVHHIHGDAADLPQILPESWVGAVDVIYSVIPLMYLSKPLRRKILLACQKVLKPGGTIYHVTYSHVSPFSDEPLIKAERVVTKWLNLPPGFVWKFMDVERVA
jgi:phosphatidylethanolamine/phosphatidyl-N-methylethanolamine N-methyltransferase